MTMQETLTDLRNRLGQTYAQAEEIRAKKAPLALAAMTGHQDARGEIDALDREAVRVGLEAENLELAIVAAENQARTEKAEATAQERAEREAKFVALRAQAMNQAATIDRLAAELAETARAFRATISAMSPLGVAPHSRTNACLSRSRFTAALRFAGLHEAADLPHIPSHHAVPLASQVAPLGTPSETETKEKEHAHVA